MTVTSGRKAEAFAALADARPDLRAAQVCLLVDVAASLVDDDEREVAVELVKVAARDDATAERIVHLLGADR